MKKVGNFILGLLPVIIYFGIQFAAIFAGGIIIAIFNRELLDNIQEFTVRILFLQGLFGFVIFGLWYAGVFRDIKRTPISEIFTLKRVLMTFAMAICYQVVITFAISIASIFFSAAVEKYTELIDEFVDEESLIMVLYTIIIAPLTEELAFRGVTLNHMKKALPFWLANIIQALLFGIMHMNIIQGSYAFILGMILGLIYRKYNTLYASIALHFCINLSGLLLSNIIGMPTIIYLLLILASFVGVIYSLTTLLKSKK